MMARRVWETLKREGACEKFEVRGSGDQWGLYCTEVDQVRDPGFGQKNAGKDESALKKAMRVRCKQLLASAHGNVALYRHVLSLPECAAQHKEAQKFLDKHAAGQPEAKPALAVTPPPVTMLDCPASWWTPMKPAETWTDVKMAAYLENVAAWRLPVGCHKDLALAPRVLELEKVGEVSFSSMFRVKPAALKATFEHPFTKAPVVLIMNEQHLQLLLTCSWCPNYGRLYRHLDGTIATEGVRVSREHDEYQRQRREQELVDGSWEAAMIEEDEEEEEAQRKRPRTTFVKGGS